LLLDISLYVSFENYRNRTRSAFTKILPWYANFVVPPQRRHEARERTQHLGVSSLDVDDIHEDVIDKPSSMQSEQQKKPFEHETEKQARRLLGRRDTVRTLLQQPEHAAAFKLNALADNFFEPLQELLKNQSNLLGTDQPAIVDCLAFGYMSLMFYPKMPQNWLASTMRLKYQKLVVYLGSMRDTLKVDAHPDEALSALSQSEKGAADLPWLSPQTFGPIAVVRYIGQSLFSHLPLPKTNSGLEHLPTKRQPSLLQRYLPAVLGLTSTSFGLMAFWAYNNLTWPHGEAVHFFGRRRFVDYGAAGATLSALGGLALQMQQQQQQTQAPVQIDVAVDEQVSP
jgi:sorting and assembly machinery component 37